MWDATILKIGKGFSYKRGNHHDSSSIIVANDFPILAKRLLNSSAILAGSVIVLLFTVQL